MKTRTFFAIIAMLFLSMLSLEAHDKTVTVAARSSAATSAEKPGFFRRLFSREKAKPAVRVSPPVAGARPKPKPNLAETSAARRSQGQRLDPKRGVTKAVPATASARKVPAKVATKGTVKAEPEKPLASVLDRAPAPAPIDTKKKQQEYSKQSALGLAMRDLWGKLSGEAARPTTVERETLPRVRVTAYHKGDANSAAKRSSTGVPLRPATESQIGVAAGPAELLGSYAIVKKDGGERLYLIADTGSDVEKETASGGEAPVIDLYEPRAKGESIASWQNWDSYQTVQIVRIEGAAHLLLQDVSRRDDYLERDVFHRALEIASKS